MQEEIDSCLRVVISAVCGSAGGSERATVADAMQRPGDDQEKIENCIPSTQGLRTLLFTSQMCVCLVC